MIWMCDGSKDESMSKSFIAGCHSLTESVRQTVLSMEAEPRRVAV